MTTSKTLKLKKPLNFLQQARLSQLLQSPFPKERLKKGRADNKSKKDREKETYPLKELNI